MYKVELTKQVRRFLDKKANKFVKKVFQNFKLLPESPYKNNLDIKPIKGQKGLWRLRIGTIRFIYSIKKKQSVILILKADSRGQVYKKK